MSASKTALSGRTIALGIGAAAFCMALTGSPSPALAKYPEKPITVIIGWGPGGGIDTFVRTVAKYAPKYLGVELKPVEGDALNPIGMVVTNGRTCLLNVCGHIPRYAGASRSLRNRGF